MQTSVVSLFYKHAYRYPQSTRGLVLSHRENWHNRLLSRQQGTSFKNRLLQNFYVKNNVMYVVYSDIQSTRCKFCCKCAQIIDPTKALPSNRLIHRVKNVLARRKPLAFIPPIIAYDTTWPPHHPWFLAKFVLLCKTYNSISSAEKRYNFKNNLQNKICPKIHTVGCTF